MNTSDHICQLTALEWENQFFGCHSALLTLAGDRLPDPAALQDYQLVQVKVPAAHSAQLDALAALGFVLVEGEADCMLPVTPVARADDIRIARPQHIAALRSAAAQAFSLSRFRAPWYAPTDSGRFYAQWIENAVQGTFDHQCLLAVDKQGAMQGFVSLRELPDGCARVGLLAVLPEFQRCGVGQRLIEAASDWCRARRLNRLYIATQLGNIAALRLYLGCGGVIERTAYWLYRKTR